MTSCARICEWECREKWTKSRERDADRGETMGRIDGVLTAIKKGEFLDFRDGACRDSRDPL